MSHNVYTSVAISGYNASPPADDGSAVKSNKVEWAKHKTQLADPIKVLAEAIDTEIHAAFNRLVMTDDPGKETVIVAMAMFDT